MSAAGSPSSLQPFAGRRARTEDTPPPFLATPPPNPRALAEERLRLDEDIAELRRTEANLQAYEKRLRALQAELDGMSRQQRATHAPLRVKSGHRAVSGGDAAALKEEWEKIIRARELLELEQAHVRGDRLALNDETAVVRRRAQAVAEREACVLQREQALQEAEARVNASGTPERDESPAKTPNMLAKMTRAPFAMTRSLLRQSKPRS